MSRSASMIITKTKILWSAKSDSHEDIIEEYKLDDGIRGDFARVEITPLFGDYSRPLDKWIYRTDHYKPSGWYNAREAELAVRRELPNWAAVHIIRQHGNAKPIEITEGLSRIVLGGKVTQSGGECRAYGRTQVTQRGGICYANGHVRVIQRGGICHANDHVRVIHSSGICYLSGNAKKTRSKK